MSIDPLLRASPATQVHAFAAMTAFVLGLVQFAAPKGTLPHRTVGWIWVVLMLTICASSLYLHTLRIWGQWSPIHLLSIGTPVALAFAVWAAHTHRVQSHQHTMVWIFCGALVIAGVFTLVPGRLMHAVVFGAQ